MAVTKDELKSMVDHLDNAVSSLKDSLEEKAWIISRLQKENEELQDGGCRFNCSSEREAFIAGYVADLYGSAQKAVMPNAKRAYKEWKHEKRDAFIGGYLADFEPKDATGALNNAKRAYKEWKREK